MFLTTLLLLLGLQALRVSLPSFAPALWQLFQFSRIGSVILIEALIFAPLLSLRAARRLWGVRGELVLAAGGLALARLGIQLGRSPLKNLALALICMALLGRLLQLRRSLGYSRSAPDAISELVLALPLAFVLDTASRSLLWSYDLAWRHTWSAALVVVGWLGLLLILVYKELDIGESHNSLYMWGVRHAPCRIWDEKRTWACSLPNSPESSKELTGGVQPGPSRPAAPGAAWPLLGMGPWLYLALAVLHHPPVLAAATGWSDVQAHLAVNCFIALGALTCVLVAGRASLQRRRWALALGVLQTAALTLLVTHTGPGWLWLGLASLAAWSAWGQIISSPFASQGRSGLLTLVALALALLLILLANASNSYWLTPAAGGSVALAALWAAGAEKRERNGLRAASLKVSAVAASTLLFVGAWAWQNRFPPTAIPPLPDRPLRVMTYNIHSGINANRQMDLQGIAAVIARENPDVLLLNEVSRARANNGFVDTLPLISQRLHTPYVFGANSRDGQYGNALFSRYPILHWENVHYEHHDTAEIRGLLRIVIQTASGPLDLYGTHLDTIYSGEVRAQQMDEALAAWASAPRTILLGDFNTPSGQSATEKAVQAGFIDALSATGQRDVFTYWHARPRVRYDYIFLTPDLPLRRAWVVPSRASDHLPVLVEVE